MGRAATNFLYVENLVMKKADIVVAGLVLGLSASLLIDILVWEELRLIRLDLLELRDRIQELEQYRILLSSPPVSYYQAIEIVSDYTHWSMFYLRKYNTSAELWYVKITNSTTTKGCEYINKVLKLVSDYRPEYINENETLCYVWIVTIHDPELSLPVPHGVNWYVNAYDGEVIDIFLHH